MFCYMAPLNINTDVYIKKQRIDNLIHAFTVHRPTHNAGKNVLPTQKNTACKNCRFISVCKNPPVGNTPHRDYY